MIQNWIRIITKILYGLLPCRCILCRICSTIFYQHASSFLNFFYYLIIIGGEEEPGWSGSSRSSSSPESNQFISTSLIHKKTFLSVNCVLSNLSHSKQTNKQANKQNTNRQTNKYKQTHKFPLTSSVEVTTR